MIMRTGKFIVVKKDKDVIYEGKDGFEGWGNYSNSQRFYFAHLLEELDSVDTYLVDEESGLSIPGMFGLYCANNGLAFYMNWRDLNRYSCGSEVALEGFDPAEDEELMNRIKEWMEEE